MAEISWIDEAKDDVREILEYLTGVDPSAAVRYVAGIEEAVDRLEIFPLSGRRYNRTFRCVVFRNHLVFYRFDEAADIVLISSVIDGRRDLADLVGEAD